MRISDWSSDVCSSDLIADDFSVQPATGVVLVGIIGRVECDDAAAQHFRVIGTVDRRPAAEHAVGVACRYRAAVGKHEIGKSRSEEHTSELQSLMRISYAVFCLKTKTLTHTNLHHNL